MIVYALFAAIAAFFAWLIWQQRLDKTGLVKNDNYIYVFGTGLMVAIMIYYLYSYFFYWQVGEDLKYFTNCGNGIIFTDQTGVNHTFFHQNDTVVGEYLALQRGDFSVIRVMTPALEVLFVGLALFMVWFYTNKVFFGKKGDG